MAPPGTDGDSFPIDPYLIASRLARDSVLSHHTALQYHGRAYTIWQQFTYQATRPAAPLRFRSNEFRGTKFPSALVSRDAQMYDVLTLERANVSLRVASLERTMVDVMNSPAYSGGWEEVWRSLESVEFFDLDRVVEYALLLNNATTVARVGFFLEQHKDASWLMRLTWPRSADTGRGGPTTLTVQDAAADWCRNGTWWCLRTSWSAPGRRSHEDLSGETVRGG